MASVEATDIIAAALARLPGLRAVLEQCGDLTLSEYSRTFFPERDSATIDPLDDLLDAAHARAAPLLGKETARGLREQLEQSPSVLTANHHGLDTLHQSVHSTIAFALPVLLGHSRGPRVVPVLACAGVPLGSVTYPRGVVLARKPDPADAANPAKTRIPFFPHAMRTCTTGAAPPLKEEHFGKALERCNSYLNEGLLTSSQNTFLEDFIQSDCRAPDVLGLPSFADQAVVLNARLWPRLFAPEVRESAPSLAYLDLERVVSMILERDLRRNSLAAALLMDDDVRGRLLDTLDGVDCCWTLQRLHRLRDMPAGTRLNHDDLRGAGTCFFWMVDRSGRHLPLWIEQTAHGPALAGRTMKGEPFAVDLAPKPIIQALAERLISPSLFTSYAALAMARGVRCWGGVYQADYLQDMQRGVAHAVGGHEPAAPPSPRRDDRRRGHQATKVANAPCGCFLAGLITVFATFPGEEPWEERTAPACAPDIAAAGGLTGEQIERMAGLTLAQTTIAGLLQTYEEITPQSERVAGWFGTMAGYTLKDKRKFLLAPL
ncbi:MAG: hypothetical protein ACOCWR_03225 [Oceanidesulfovibrio sp.]